MSAQAFEKRLDSAHDEAFHIVYYQWPGTFFLASLIAFESFD